jgi:hypothetical protein
VGDDAPSRTAQHVAAYRLGFERLPAPVGDPESDERLARDLLTEFEFEPQEPMAGYLRVRTSFFDRVVLNALERGTIQVAAIGACSRRSASISRSPNCRTVACVLRAGSTRPSSTGYSRLSRPDR